MRLMINSIPKSGTHLLLKLVDLLGFPENPDGFWIGANLINGRFSALNKLKRGYYNKDFVPIGCETPTKVGYKWLSHSINSLPDNTSFGSHCLYSDKMVDLCSHSNTKIICIIRDPRSIIFSHFKHIESKKNHYLHDHFINLKNDKERLLFSIYGGELKGDRMRSIVERYADFNPWMDSPEVLVIKFEDLIGENGGGSKDTQSKVINDVSKFIGINNVDVNKIQSSLYGLENTQTKSKTFRKGKIDSWKDEVSPELLESINEEFEGILEKFEY